MGQLFVITAGLNWLFAACIMAEVGRILGPSYHTKVTVPWGWRLLAFLAALILFIRATTLLFPGRLIEVSRISLVAPLASMVVMGLTLVVLDWVMRDRAPPPWSVQVMRIAALLGRNGPVKFAAMAVPPAPVGAAPPSDEPMPLRRSRLPVLIGASVVLAAMALFLALNNGAGG